MTKFPPGKAPNVTVTGTCFGTSGAFNGDIDHFRITDLGAQIAVYEANCTQTDAVGIGADKGKRAAYSADDFACKATPEGAGPEWAKAWDGTYYAHDC